MLVSLLLRVRVGTADRVIQELFFMLQAAAPLLCHAAASTHRAGCSSLREFSFRSKVQWRRFFTWTWAFEELDDSWTARLVTGRFVTPKLIDILARCGARTGDHEQEEKELEERAAKEACLRLGVAGIPTTPCVL